MIENGDGRLVAGWWLKAKGKYNSTRYYEKVRYGGRGQYPLFNNHHPVDSRKLYLGLVESSPEINFDTLTFLDS
jgi:hypothetical protein